MADITHPQLVTALVKPPENIISSLSVFTVDLWHGATGVAGEAGELLEAFVGVLPDQVDRVNVKEELGDLYFYVEQIVQRAEVILEWDKLTSYARNRSLVPDLAIGYAAQICIYACGVLDTVKKAAIYNKELNKIALHAHLEDLVIVMITLGYMYGIERQDALNANIAKLKIRYDGLQYTDRAAQLRMDKPPERNFIRGDAENGVVSEHNVHSQSADSEGRALD